MNSCEPFQHQLLDHLYGLLDEAERQPLVDHLAACQGCQDALAQAQAGEQARAAQERRAVQEQILALEKQWTGQVEKVRREAREKQVQVRITGPKNLQAGAPTKSQIQAHNPARPGPQADVDLTV